MRRRVGFFGALGLFFKRYLDFMGNSTRAEYWYMVIWNALYGVVMMSLMLGSLLSLVSAHTQIDAASVLSLGIPVIVAIIVALATIVPFVALHIRRYRDAGVSPWWFVLTYVVPVILQAPVVNRGMNAVEGLAGILLIVNLVIAAQPSRGLHF